DAKYKVNCRFEATPNAKPFEMATYSGNVKTYIQYGILHFEIDGKKHQLSIYRSPMLMRIEAYANHLFAPFKDATNGVTTYGGGRYIDLEIGHIKDNKVVLDFNKCYNPWCAYSSGYNCPVPPRENHLSIAIEAGEKNYKGKKQ
ncbi:MAG TPA: DUF1684 domain-containing protein, partial [Phaeodactylibacter sp.]|nr:DUF1684 domain-containing protein [Phaeodactylibacter sp.]